jgi:hypothetical protein
MYCGGLLFRSFVLAAICALTFPTLARGSFEILSHNVSVDAISRQTTFTVTFNQPPDFFTADELGRPADGFQFFYDSQPTDGEIDFAGDDVAIIRGVEIRVDHDIPIRDSLNPSGEEFPNAEGWGETRGAVDYQLDGAMLSFTTSWELLGETDDVFGYRLFALQEGELTSEVTFLSRIVVPLPTPLLFGAIGLLLSACASIRRI